MKDAASPSTRMAGQVEWWVAAAGASVGLVFVAALLERCRYGFDVTDEGFCLNWIASPQNFKASLSQFGFVYHPLHRLVGGSVVALRQVSLLLTLALAWILCLSLTRRWAGGRGPRGSDHFLAVTLATSSLGALLYSCWWTPAPGYNSLAFQAVLLCALALTALTAEPRRAAWAGTALGCALALALLAKPTTAVALGVFSAASLVIAGQLTARLAAVVLVAAGVAASSFAVAVDGSLPRFLRRLLAGLEDARLLGGGHSLGAVLRVDGFSFTAPEWRVFAVLAVGTFVLVAAAVGRSRAARVAWGALAAGVCCATVMLGRSIWLGPPGALITVLRPVKFQGLQMMGVAVGALAALAATIRWKEAAGPAREGAATAAFLALCPYAYAFGTNGNYWLAASNVSALWLWACVPLVVAWGPERARRALLSIGVVGQCVTMAFVVVGLENPYRQSQPLRLNNETVPLLRGGSLSVSRSTARYLATLAAMAAKRGLTAGTPMVDLTGHSPGALYAIGAAPLGHAWMIGGYPGSRAFVASGLDRAPCGELARAWVLDEPGGPRAITAEVLQRYGIEPASDFEVVGELASPAEDYPTSERQRILKPARKPGPAEAACEAARARRTASRASSAR